MECPLPVLLRGNGFSLSCSLSLISFGFRSLDSHGREEKNVKECVSNNGRIWGVVWNFYIRSGEVLASSGLILTVQAVDSGFVDFYLLLAFGDTNRWIWTHKNQFLKKWLMPRSTYHICASMSLIQDRLNNQSCIWQLIT